VTGDLAAELSDHVDAEVRFDDQARAAYATDAVRDTQPAVHPQPTVVGSDPNAEVSP